jgi:WD40 repeat protein
MQFFPKASITIFDMITGDKKCTIDDDDRHLISQSPHRCMQFSPDGKRLALACKSAIVFWDTSTGKVVTTWPGRAYSLSPYFANGTRIASSGGASVSIWDVEKGKVIKTFIGGTSAFAITPDELTVFSQNGIVRIWDLADGNLRKEVKEYSGTYQSVVTPNNRTGIWPTNVGLVVFDLETGTKKQDLTLNEPYLMGLAMTTDGKTLITSDSKGLIKGWNVNANGMVE